ncbi:MAG: penicillin-binding protein 1B [Gammaproteobacteria bacterium]
MPSSKSPGTKRYPRNSKQPPRKRRGVFSKLVLLALIVLGFVFASYVGYLDYTVRHQFEGKRWAIPARVYAAPIELYAGYALTPAQLEDLLQLLHYERDYQLTAEGSYYRDGEQINIKTRDFVFWDQHQASSRIRVSFVRQSVGYIADLDKRQSIAIFRLDPVQIGSFYPTRKEDRVLIKLQEAPKTLIQGLLASEDRDFYHHFGLSPRSILRAMWVNLRAGGLVQGGSTITQQLIKNFYLSSERSLRRKVNEALMALILEYHYSKDEILEAYLNEVYLGQDGANAVHGFGLASEFYFGHPLKDLPLHQVASLVALVRGPSQYDLRKNTVRAVKRRNLILDEMQEFGYITAQQAAAAKRQALGVIPYTHRSANRYPCFLDLVRRQLTQEYREKDLTSEGLRIFTTLDTHVQDSLQRSIDSKLPLLEKNPQAKNLETAAVVTRRDNGEIVALAGARDNADTGFNRALDALRSVGSLIKPAVYLTAVEAPERFTITTPVSDTAVSVNAGNGRQWTPKNYDHRQHGVIPLHSALAHSYNLATVRIGMDMGLARVAKTLRNMGVSRDIDLYPSLLLGALSLTPLEVTQMYQTLASDGFATPLRAIRAVLSASGKALQHYPYTVRQTLDSGAAYITNTMLQEVVREGTGRSAYASVPASMKLAGKTGTTDEMRDSWFAGYSGDYLSVVWVGRDDNKPAGVTGATGALRVWTALMREIAKQPVELSPPDNIEMVWIDPHTGLRADETCSGAKYYPYIKGSAPVERAPCGQVYPDQQENWLHSFY